MTAPIPTIREYITQLQQQIDLWLIEANRMFAANAGDQLEQNYWEGMRTAYSKFATTLQTDLANLPE